MRLLNHRLRFAIRGIGAIVLAGTAGCGHSESPVQPTRSAEMSRLTVALEGESGTGDGRFLQRPRASSGITIHLGPGERRSWPFAVTGGPALYTILVIYSNGHYGESELITTRVDGFITGSFVARDTGADDEEGWNTFVTDSAGSRMLGPGNHMMMLEVTGGDGCVEIDLVRLTPE